MARIDIRQADITQLEVDAIVNAANEQLSAGSGVCAAIHRAAGPQLAEECREIGVCATGDAVITGACNLRAKYVIHAVGPKWQGGDHGESDLLADCYRKSIELAEQHSLSSIAFPAISCGVYGYPIAEAAAIAIETTLESLSRCEHLEDVVFACFGTEIETALKQAAARHAL